MRATVYHGPRDVRVEEVPDPVITAPADAIVRVTHACICGSDLWPYRGELLIYGEHGRTGHEFMGVVEDVGSEVTTLRPGDRVIAPFAFHDGTCEFCLAGLHTSCVRGGYWGGTNDGGQGEGVRVPLADGTLVPLPPEVDLSDQRLAAALATLTDVMGTGHHAALRGGVGPGHTVAVVGDGAVGLCAVLAALRLGAERVIVLGHHEDRLALARRFGATEVVTERGDEAVERVRELTGGGAPAVLECVGSVASINTAIRAARPGGTVGARRRARRGGRHRPAQRARAQRGAHRRGGPGARLPARAGGRRAGRPPRPLPRARPHRAPGRGGGGLRGDG